MLNKQSQLNKIFTNRTEKRTDKIVQLSKKQRGTGKDVWKKDNIEDREQVMAQEKAESTVVKDGNTLKSKIGFIRTTQEDDYLVDDEEDDKGNNSDKVDDVGAEANNSIPENFGAVDVGENVVVVANNANENAKKKIISVGKKEYLQLFCLFDHCVLNNQIGKQNHSATFPDTWTDVTKNTLLMKLIKALFTHQRLV